MAELAYAEDLKSLTFGFVGSTPTAPTKKIGHFYIILRILITKDLFMVENKVDKEEQSEVSYLKFDDPEDEYQRAKSDYLYISRHYENYYTVSGYIEAEDKAWKRYEEAYNALKLDSQNPS